MIWEIKMLFQKKQALPINVQYYIYETYFKLVYKLALSFTRDVCLAEDICQDVFMICFNRYHQLKDPQKTGPWLSTITINTARNFIRRNRKVITIPLEDIGEIEASVEIRPESELERQELRAFLFKEIGQLPVEFQEVLVLKYYHDLTVANIGEILKIPEGTVRSRLHRARQKIKRVLKIQRNFKIQIWGGRKMDNSSTPDDKLEELIKATLKEYIDGQETAPEIKDRVRQNLGLKQKRTASSSRKKFLIGVAAAIICIILGSVILFPGQVNAFSMPLFKRFGYFINNKVYNISETYRPDSSQKLPSAPPPENEIDSSLYKKVDRRLRNAVTRINAGLC
jgi:RNA polymerase sigma-70 factor (ECF subfamily)